METHLKLAAWIAGRGLSQPVAAKLFGTTPTNLSKWVNKKAKPGLRAAFIIQTATDGEITMEMWANE